jgi:hypothetical protein
MSDKKIEKEKIDIIPEPLVEIEYGDSNQKILVQPYISLTNKTILFRGYLESYFKDGEVSNNYIDAKYSFMLGIVDLCTSIPLEGIDLDDFISSGLWEKIRKSIKNYDDVRADLYDIIKLATEKNILEKSMSTTFDRLAESLMQFLYKIDLSSEGIKNLIDSLRKESDDFDNKFIKPSSDLIEKDDIEQSSE